MTGISGLALLTLQSVLLLILRSVQAVLVNLHYFTMLSFSSFVYLALPQGKPELRSVHAYLGSAILALFLVHAAFGLQLGLSF